MPIDKFVTHKIDGLEKVNQAIDALHSGDCLRAVVKINNVELAVKPPKFGQIDSKKVTGGSLKRIQHVSEVTGCQMIFSIYIPDQKVRCEAPPAVLYYLSGLTCTDENARTKAAAVYEAASKYNFAVVFPDTSPRGVEIPGHDDKQYDLGSGAGFYINATNGAWAENYKMQSYVTQELPSLIE